MAKNSKPTHEVWGITERRAMETSDGGEKTRNFWTRLGVGFTNQDNSVNLLFDYIPANGARIQLRPMRQPKASESELPLELGLDQ